MQLQNKNLRLLVEHNDIMTNINKGDSQSRRDSKFATNQSIKRLERDLEKSSKQLQQEIHNIRSQNGENYLSIDLLQELENLFTDVDDYFQYKHTSQAQTIKHQRNYSGVRSKINTNLPNKVMGVGQKKFGKEVRQIME